MTKDKSIFDVRKIFLTHMYTVENYKCFRMCKEYLIGRKQVLFISTFQLLRQEDLGVRREQR